MWVPVVDEDFERYDGYAMGQIQSDTMEQMETPNYFESLSEPYKDGYTNEESEYNAMRASVLECKVKRNVKLNLKMIEITEF